MYSHNDYGFIYQGHQKGNNMPYNQVRSNSLQQIGINFKLLSFYYFLLNIE